MATINPMLRQIVGMVYGKLPDASLPFSVKFFQKAISIAPDKVMHRAALAKTYAAMGQQEKAKRTLAAAESLIPTDKEESRMLAEAHEVVGKSVTHP